MRIRAAEALAGIEDASDSIVKERRRQASRRENKKQYTSENLCCQEHNIYLSANSNELWKSVRTETKVKPRTQALGNRAMGHPSRFCEL